jgi:ElaB/YqjD/DUF883 family membrane-anchored ribosome-binding protein
MTTLDSKSPDKKTPHQIESEIDRTRSAISDDIRALGEKLSPEHLKQEAKEVLRDAKEEATDMLRTAKDHAIESVTDTVHELSDRARRAGTAATGFASTHAVPLTLLGLGAGWLLLSLRHQRMMSEGSHAMYHRDDRYNRADGSARGDHLLDGARERVGEFADHAAAQIESAKTSVKGAVSELSHRAAELTHRASDAVVSVSHDAGEQARRATAAARDFTHENPLAVGALALAAGVGVGLLLPSTPVENDLMGSSRDRLVGDARYAADRVRHMAEDAASELKGAIAGA